MNFCFESLLEGMPLLAYPRLFFGEGKDERDNTIWTDCTSERAVLL